MKPVKLFVFLVLVMALVGCTSIPTATVPAPAPSAVVLPTSVLAPTKAVTTKVPATKATPTKASAATDQVILDSCGDVVSATGGDVYVSFRNTGKAVAAYTGINDQVLLVDLKDLSPQRGEYNVRINRSGHATMLCGRTAEQYGKEYLLAKPNSLLFVNGEQYTVDMALGLQAKFDGAKVTEWENANKEAVVTQTGYLLIWIPKDQVWITVYAEKTNSSIIKIGLPDYLYKINISSSKFLIQNAKGELYGEGEIIIGGLKFSTPERRLFFVPTMGQQGPTF